MQRVAFKMKLFSGCEAEYRERHNKIWPELVTLLKQNGISDYSIFLDEETNILFGVLKIENAEMLNKLPLAPVMQQWWSTLTDVMETREDNSPISIPLKEIFYLQ
jgi:L-rhamnose mutarotase